MKLTELNPQWVGAGGEGIYNADGTKAQKRTGVGISFYCPCPDCTSKRIGNEDHDFYYRVFVAFENPVDGGPAHDPRPNQQWKRVGEDFAALTLTPSIQRHRIGEDGCTWHGYITNGEVITA